MLYSFCIENTQKMLQYKYQEWLVATLSSVMFPAYILPLETKIFHYLQ